VPSVLPAGARRRCQLRGQAEGASLGVSRPGGGCPNAARNAMWLARVCRAWMLPIVAGCTAGAASGPPGAAPVGGSASAMAARQAVAAGWSAPAVVARNPPGFNLWWPDLAPSPAGGYIAWAWMQVKPPPGHASRPPVGSGGAVRTLSGHDIGMPPGARFFLVPKAAVDAGGRLQVFWGEPMDTIAERHPERPLWSSVGSVWHASYDAALGWSPARPVVTSPMMHAWGGRTRVRSPRTESASCTPSSPCTGHTGPGTSRT
jgi:hypothetical protein